MEKRFTITRWLLPAMVTSLQMAASAQEKTVIPFRYIGTDSAETIASNQYKPNSFLRRIFMGSNYRKEWKQLVVLPVFRLSKTRFTIKELGGGMQTKSLQLEDESGNEWALRSVEKYVSAALPKILQNTLAKKATQDFISSAFPYGAPVAGELSYRSGVSTARPKVFFVADDEALGTYRHLFANTVCTLEERDAGFKKTDNTITVLENLRADNRHKIQQPVLLKARIMDMLTGDWDRHSDNWKWGMKDSAGFQFYYAVARDKDWVFYQSNGLAPKLARLLALRHLVNFSEQPRQIKNLSWKATLFDKKFLNELTADDWERTIENIQAALTDSAIEAAVKKMPASVYTTDGFAFINKLKKRRDGLKEAVMKYYRFLSEEIIINGSYRSELFSIIQDGKRLKVIVYELTENGNKKKIYERSFSSSETYFITINGLGGNDVFDIDEESKSKIKIIIYGGEGNDSYTIKGDVRTKVFDTASEKNTVIYKGKAMFRFR